MQENNIVQPMEKRSDDPLFRALQVSGSRKSSLYNLSKSDRENGYYFTYYGLEVPFSAILNENNKTRGIVGIAFGTAKDCPSRFLGLCQLPTDALCYARAGERRATKRDNENGEKGMDSYYNGLLCSAFWDSFETNPQTRLDFIDYLEAKGIETIRFNLKSDFRHLNDVVAIYSLAQTGFKLTGYTARDDLEELQGLADHPNIILNGSNRMYTNRFKATTSIKEYVEADFPCLGSCSNCGNCYRLRGETITVLIHGNGSNTALNTVENRDYILKWSKNVLPWDVLRDTDFSKAKGLITCINKELKKVGVMLRFKDAKDLANYIREWGEY